MGLNGFTGLSAGALLWAQVAIACVNINDVPGKCVGSECGVICALAAPVSPFAELAPGFDVIQRNNGVYVARVLRHSPAAEAGLQAEDRLVAVDGIAVPFQDSIWQSASWHAVSISRGGNALTLRMRAEPFLSVLAQSLEAKAPSLRNVSVDPQVSLSIPPQPFVSGILARAAGEFLVVEQVIPHTEAALLLSAGDRIVVPASYQSEQFLRDVEGGAWRRDLDLIVITRRGTKSQLHVAMTSLSDLAAAGSVPFSTGGQIAAR